MTWVRLDDGFLDHPKVAAAGLAAEALYINGLCYCARHLTNGRIPAGVVPGLARAPATNLVRRLLDVGLWQADEGGYLVHDYLKYNPTRSDVEARRTRLHEIRADAGRKGGRPPSINETTGKQNKKQNESIAIEEQNESPVPVTPAPAPDTSRKQKSKAGTTGRADKPRREKGPDLGPLVDAFRNEGLRDPYFESGNSTSAQTLLRGYTPSEIAECWRDIEQGEFGDDYNRRNLSFRHLASVDIVGKWVQWSDAGKPPQERRNGGDRSSGRAIQPIGAGPGADQERTAYVAGRGFS